MKDPIKILANLVINEIAPRAKKRGCSFTEVATPAQLSWLVLMEEQGRLTRHQTREVLGD